MPVRLNPLTSLTVLPKTWQNYQPVQSTYGQHQKLSWTGDDAHLIVRHLGSRGDSITAWGDPLRVLETLRRLDPQDEEIAAANLPRGVFEDERFNIPWLAPVQGREDHRWEKMIIDSPPRCHEAEPLVIPLDATWHASIKDLLALANPTTEHAPDDDDSLGWWGVVNDAAGPHERNLLAVVGAVADNRHDDARHLVAVGTHPTARRRGLAGAVVTVATRAGLEVAPYVTLGLWSHNDAARKLYEGLGYRLHAQMTTRVFGA